MTTKSTTKKTIKTKLMRKAAVQSTVIIELPTKALLRLGVDARRAGLTVTDYLLTCAKEFGHNLWGASHGSRVGGTE